MTGSWIRRPYDALPSVLRIRLRRLVLSLAPIAQCGIAAGLSWWIALEVLHHASPPPFFAPIAAVISLGLSLGRRWRRSVELVGGVTIGILVGDLLITEIGSGTWQIVVVVCGAMALAVFLDDGPLIPLQAASSAVLVATLLPPGGVGGLNRAVDALIGGVIGIAVGALLPANPAARARRDAAGVLATVRDAADRLAQGLRDGDPDEVLGALEAARSTQSAINTMRQDMRGGEEISTISPLYWGARPRVERISKTADPIDNAVRNYRVVARRTLAIMQRGEEIRPELVELLGELPGAFDILREMMLADPGDAPDQADAARVLRTLARAARRELADGRGMSETALLAEIRSLLVDLLMVAGLRRESAMATLR
ncbi:MAG: FUSC family protein [Gordonia sp. (in: high G+C Gram-positive bacteria)]